MPAIKNVNDAIEALGGTAKVSLIFGCVRSAVSNWRADGYLPADTYLVLREELKKADYEITPEIERKLWNWKRRANGKAKAR